MKTLNAILTGLPTPTERQINENHNTDYLKDEKEIEYLISLANQGNGTEDGNWIVNNAATFVFDALISNHNWTPEAAMELSIEAASYGIIKIDPTVVKDAVVAEVRHIYKTMEEESAPTRVPLDHTRLNTDIFGLADAPWTDIEVHPVVELKDQNGETYCEQCEKGQETFYSVYIRYAAGGLNCLADCEDEKTADTMKTLIETLLKHHVARE